MGDTTTGNGELSSLRSLLVGDEQRSLAELDKRVTRHHRRIGTELRLKKSVAKVIAASLREAEITQHDTLANAISPLVVASIKREIRNSQDEMVEALYPILGRLVSAYVTSAIRKLTDQTNRRLEGMLKGGRLALRAKSLLTGKPYGDLVLSSQPPELTEVLLVDRATGNLADHWRAPVENESEHDSAQLISSLLTAITDFANQAFATKQGELRMLDTGSGRIYIRATPSWLVAANFVGRTFPDMEDRIDTLLLDVFESHSIALSQPEDGNDETREEPVTPKIVPELAARLGSEIELPSRRPVLAYVLATAIALSAIGVSGWHYWKDYKAEQIIAKARSVIDADERLKGFPITLTLDDSLSTLRTSGIVPGAFDTSRLSQAVRNEVAPVDVAADFQPVAMPQGILEVRELQTELSSQLDELNGRLGSLAQVSNLEAASKRIGGLEARIGSLEATSGNFKNELSARATSDQLESIRAALKDVQAELSNPERKLAEWIDGHALFFSEGTSFLDGELARTQLKELASLLLVTGGQIRVVGHTDRLGTATANAELALKRAKHVVDMLVDMGVPSVNLIAEGSRDVRVADSEDDAKKQRRVDFERRFTQRASEPNGNR